MELVLESSCTEDYLQDAAFLEYGSTVIQSLAEELKVGTQSQIEYISKAYEYVRDQIAHSADIMEDALTFTALEVLAAKHGTCFAKSNLLAALLRAQRIPVGFCYQRLILDDEKYPYLVLHGLNGVYIKELNK